MASFSRAYAAERYGKLKPKLYQQLLFIYQVEITSIKSLFLIYRYTSSYFCVNHCASIYSLLIN